MADNPLQTRVESLEARLTYQDAALEELTATVLRQEKIIQQQARAVALLEEQLRSLGGTNVTASEETPPPHY